MAEIRRYIPHAPYMLMLLVAVGAMTVLLVRVSHVSDEAHKATEENRQLIRRVKKLTQDGVQSHAALCVIKRERILTTKRTKAFLRHPERFPVFNNPATLAIVKASQQDRKDSLKGLQFLKCDGERR